MDKLERAIALLHEIDWESGERAERERIHPSCRFLLTILFSLLVMSCGRKEYWALLGLLLYPLLQSILENIPIRKLLPELKLAMLPLLLMSLGELLFAREMVWRIGVVPITEGMLRAIGILGKGLLILCNAQMLFRNIGIQGLCQALYSLRVPAGLVTVLLLIYRYLLLLLQELRRMMQVYSLRAPGQKGIVWKSWGSFLGLLFLRSLDRAEEVYESMRLSGFDGRNYSGFGYSGKNISRGRSIGFLLLWSLFLILLRSGQLYFIVGNLLLHILG